MSATPSATGPSTAKAGRYRRRVCAMLPAATTINRIDRQVLGVFAPFLQDEIGWSGIESHAPIGTAAPCPATMVGTCRA